MNPTMEKQTHVTGERLVEPVTEGEALRHEAIASLKRKRRFYEGVGGFVAVNGVLWLIWALTHRSGDGGMPWPAWVSLIWGFFLALDAWKASAPGLAACADRSPRRTSRARWSEGEGGHSRVAAPRGGIRARR